MGRGSPIHGSISVIIWVVQKTLPLRVTRIVRVSASTSMRVVEGCHSCLCLRSNTGCCCWCLHFCWSLCDTPCLFSSFEIFFSFLIESLILISQEIMHCGRSKCLKSEGVRLFTILMIIYISSMDLVLLRQGSTSWQWVYSSSTVFWSLSQLPCSWWKTLWCVRSWFCYVKALLCYFYSVMTHVVCWIVHHLWLVEGIHIHFTPTIFCSWFK